MEICHACFYYRLFCPTHLYSSTVGYTIIIKARNRGNGNIAVTFLLTACDKILISIASEVVHMAANRLLVIEDDKGISDAVGLNLQYAGYEYMTFDDGSTVAQYLEQDHSFDLALLDIMLPGLDGFELFGHMEKYNIPVIYITAKTDSASEIKGLRGGAEDYIVKPFEMVTLLVRIEKVLDRTGKLNQIFRTKDITVDLENRTITKCGEEIDLAPLEFDVFAILIKNKNRTVPRERILNEIWGAEWFGDTRTVDVRIANIRKKLDLTDEIKTIPKTGYRLEERKK